MLWAWTEKALPPHLHYLRSSPSAAAVGLCNMMLHMFHMTNYTTQKKEGGGSVRPRKNARRRGIRNNVKEDERTRFGI